MSTWSNTELFESLRLVAIAAVGTAVTAFATWFSIYPSVYKSNLL